MNTQTLQGGNRPSLTFSLHGLSTHDETLFKSFVRLLAHRTRQQWTFTPSSTATAADVCVTAQATAHTITQGQKALIVGTAHRGEPYFVSFPFHADALEQVLNNLGENITADKRAPLGATTAISLNTQFRLLRWPSADLLATPSRMRLATMMTGRWTTLASLQERSSIPPDVCRQFVSDLVRADLLTETQAAAPSPASHQAAATRTPVTQVEAGLISRIRSRLGLFSAGRM